MVFMEDLTVQKHNLLILQLPCASVSTDCKALDLDFRFAPKHARAFC